MTKYFCLFVIFLIVSPTTLLSQNLEPDSLILKFYRQQVMEMQRSRGLADKELLQHEDFEKPLTSFEQIADVLYNYYDENEPIGFLMFFHNRDTLTRVFMQPSKVIQKNQIHIKKEKLIKITEDVYNALRISAAAKSRLPVQRTVKLGKVDAPVPINLDTALERARRVFIPEAFDEYYRHLVIIPTLNIGNFPFHMIKPYKNDSILADTCSYSIASGVYDIFAYNSFRRQKKDDSYAEVKDTLDFLFISNPAYPTNTQWVFPDLPGAQKEVEAVSSTLKNYRVLAGKDATKDAVLKQIRTAKVVYFATHGIAHPQKMMDSSFLVLAGNKDPYLTAREVMALRDSNINKYKHQLFHFPKLAVLSACQTGLGASMGAGVAGLARSFLIAGAEQVIMSLWSVDDESTSFLMTRFMFYLQKDNLLYQPAEALRFAVLDTRKKYENPLQWACFSVFGVTKNKLDYLDPY